MTYNFTKTSIKNIFILLITTTVYISCKKLSDPPAPKISIISLSVTSGPYNTTVIITGTGFDTVKAHDRVLFNGKPATVSAATSTKLTTIVPLGAGTGNVTLSVNNGTVVSGPVFTYELTPVVSTLAGNPRPGEINGTGAAASFSDPIGIAVDPTGNVYVSESLSNVIRKITAAGVVTTFAGSGVQGSANGTGTAATFNNPLGLAADASGNIYVADAGNCLIRKISPAGVVTTFAGNGSPGLVNGTSASASFNYPNGVAVDAAGNVYVAESRSLVIRKITAAGVVSTFAGSGTTGSANGTGALASFKNPLLVAVDAAGNVYVTDSTNNLIRKITTAGVVSTLAGSGGSGYTNGPAASATFRIPFGIAVDNHGNAYVSDNVNNVIRVISSSGMVSTLAGNGSYGAVNGPGASASFISPEGIAVDTAGNVYVADTDNTMVRKITFQ